MSNKLFIVTTPTGTPDTSLMAKCATEGCKNRIKTVMHKYCDDCKLLHYECKKEKQRNKRGFIYKMF